MKALSLAMPFLLGLALVESDPPEAPLERCWAELEAAAEEKVPQCLVLVAEALAPRVLGDDWSRSTSPARARFVRALAAAFRRELPDDARIVRTNRKAEARSLRVGYRVGELGEAVVEYRSPDGDRWTLEDLRWRDQSIVERYRALSEDLLSRYSFAYLVGELEGQGVVVLEDFEDGPLGGLPEGWKWRGWGQTEKKPYRVEEENGNRFLRAEDRGENVMLYKEIRWDAEKYPYLAFRFRIRAVPRGADERYEDRADSAAGLYLTYDRRFGIVPETVKFVWSASSPPGSAFRRPGVGMPWTVVVGSGEAAPDRFLEFVYHVGEVYEKTFEKEPVRRPLGFGVLTDANSTGTFAAADYDDIRALARVDAPNRILEILATN